MINWVAKIIRIWRGIPLFRTIVRAMAAKAAPSKKGDGTSDCVLSTVLRMGV